MLDNFEDVLNSNEVMQILDIKKQQLYRLIKSGDLPAFKLSSQSKSWRFKKETLIKHLISLEK